MRDVFEFFWHGDRGYANCEYGQWYMRDMKIDLTEMVNHLPFLQGWIDAGRPTTIVVNCCEQWMMFGKAVLMGDFRMGAHILTLPTPKGQKAAGRKVDNFDEALWVKWREPIVYWGGGTA